MSKLSEVFDVAPNKDGVLEITTTQVPEATNEPEDEDFNTARTNTYELIDISKAALQTAMLVSTETQNPRALEVLGQLLKTSAEINRQLLQMSKDKQEVKAVRKGVAPIGSSQVGPQIGHQTNNVFVGTSAELNRLLSGTIHDGNK